MPEEQAVALRHADCPTTEATIDIAAPADVVWGLVTDIALPARFSGEFLGAEWIDEATGPALGARFVGRNAHRAIGTWQTTSTVTACEPMQRFEWTVGDLASPAATWRFTLEPARDGRTRVTQWTRVGPGRSGINMAIDAQPEKESRIMHRRMGELRTNMQATLEGIKRLAEGG